MVGIIRNWLLCIVKQAIKEEFTGTIRPAVEQATQIQGKIPVTMWIDPDEHRSVPPKRAVPRYEPEPMGFEQEQEAALKAQSAYWEKQVKSDV